MSVSRTIERFGFGTRLTKLCSSSSGNEEEKCYVVFALAGISRTLSQGYQYSWFCSQYRLWLGKQDCVMRQTHRVGEKLFVDYAGQTVSIIDPDGGEIRYAQIFVAVLGAANYTYAEATWIQALPDWIGSHQRTFAYLGGVPEVVVPDNLLSGLVKHIAMNQTLIPPIRILPPITVWYLHVYAAPRIKPR